MSERPSILIVGAGRVGQTLGNLWVTHQVAQIRAVCNTSLSSAQDAIRFIGQGDAYCDLSQCPAVDIVVVTTPDDQLTAVISEVQALPQMPGDLIIMHCSGCYASTDYTTLIKSSSQLASVHPVMSVSSPELAVKQFKHIMCGYEGSSKALAVLLPLFEAIGGIPFKLIPHQKAAYHVGMVMASNYLVALSEMSRLCLEQAGLSESTASSLVNQIMQQTLVNIGSSNTLSDALTGPIQRGDEATLLRHRMALGDDLEEIYQLVGLRLLALTSHSSQVLDRLEHVLTDDLSKGL
ncbi:MAG: hypothetical protein CL816_04550 [Coxiellaceae bacterium]|nr:hypothetical protein [Coxiellaceae bacterium]